MKRFLLDTGPLAAYFLGRPAAQVLIDPWIVRREVATSILVYAEILEYVRQFADFTRQRTRLRRLYRTIYAYELSYADLDRYTEIRLRLRPPRGIGPIGDIDTLIAATALERGLAVVTMDRDFERVPDLDVVLVDRHV